MTVAVQADQFPTSPTRLTLLKRVIPYLGMFLLALLVWLPFGFKTTGLIEEIGINQLSDAGYQNFFVTLDSPMSYVRTRPLQMFTFALAFALDHDSYTYYNILMMLFLFGNMVVAYWLVLQFLPGKKLLAFVTGVLYAIYPADTGLFALRTIHIHCAALAYLFAVYLLIQFIKLRSRWSYTALIGAMLLLAFSLLQYQIALAAALVTPVLLLYFTRPNRRFWIGTGLWYVAMLAVLLYSLWANGQLTIKSYESGLLPTQFSLNDIPLMLQALGMAYFRQISSWAAAFNKLAGFPLFGIYVIVGVAISASIGGYLIWRERRTNNIQPVSRQRYELLFIGAIAWFTIGIATYLPIPSHRVQDFRIFFLAMLASAFILALVLYLLSRIFRRYSTLLFLVFTLPFIGLAYMSAFEQQQGYVNYSVQQQNILQQTIAQAPQIKPHTAILMIDQTGVLDQEYVFFYGYYLSGLMQYLYEDSSIKSSYCLADNIPTVKSIRCSFDGSMLHMSYDIKENENYYGPVLNVPTDQLLIFMIEAGGRLKLLTAEQAAQAFQITGYDPQARIIGQKPPRRAATLFSCQPALSCYHVLPNTFQTTFELPENGDIGTGWRTTETDDNAGIFRWSVTPITSVNVDLSYGSDLSIDFKVLHWVEASVIDSLKLSLYGQDLPLTFEPTEDGGRIYHATIPSSFLVGQPSHAYLVFKVDKITPISDNVSLGFALNWLRIRPVSSEH
ncbi:MAG: hypothetical protein GC179_02015 [Anaerolineaceae bacterium]|nr:hypothetical protein [Anaerolineaceae bacterium]